MAQCTGTLRPAPHLRAVPQFGPLGPLRHHVELHAKRFLAGPGAFAKTPTGGHMGRRAEGGRSSSGGCALTTKRIPAESQQRVWASCFCGVSATPYQTGTKHWRVLEKCWQNLAARVAHCRSTSQHKLPAVCCHTAMHGQKMELAEGPEGLAMFITPDACRPRQTRGDRYCRAARVWVPVPQTH